MKCIPIVFPVLLSILAAVLPAQVTEAAGQGRLDRAILIEEQEHDLREAERLYREVAEDESVADRVRWGAWLRLGQLLLRVDRDEEARVALQRAAEGMGAVASTAQTLLEEPEQDRGREIAIREQVGEALRLLAEHHQVTANYEIPGLRRQEPVENLIWIGEPAVPEIIRTLNELVADGPPWEGLPVGLACLLWKIGGEEVERFLDATLENPDVEFRRIVVSGAPYTDQESLIRKAEAFLEDPDPEGIVPTRALVDRYLEGTPGAPTDRTHRLFQNYDTDRIVELVDSDVDVVRIRALYVLTNFWGELRHDEGQAATMDLLAPAMERALSDTSPTVGQAAAQFLAGVGIMSSAAGRSVFLRSLPSMDRDFRNSSNNATSPSNFASPTEHLTEVLAAARAMGPAQSSARRNRHPRQDSLHNFISYCLPQWGSEAFPGVLELVRMGHDAPDKNRTIPGSLTSWLTQRAQPEDAEDLASLLPVSGSTDEIVRWLSRTPLTSAVIPYLAQYKNSLTEDGLRRSISTLGIAMGRTGHEAFGEDLLGLARANPRTYYQRVVRGLVWLAETNPSERVRALLREALLLESPDPSARNVLFACLVRLGDTRAIPLLKPAYEHGLQPQGYPVPVSGGGNAWVGAQWLGLVWDGNNTPIEWHGYSDEDLALCIEQLLTLGDETVWETVFNSICQTASGSERLIAAGRYLDVRDLEFREPSTGVISVVSREWSRQFSSTEVVPDRILLMASAFTHASANEGRFGRRNADAIRSMQGLCLTHPDPMARLLAVKTLPAEVCRERSEEILALSRDDEFAVATAAVDRFADAGVEVDEDLFASLVAHENPRFRTHIVNTVGVSLGERGEPLVIGLLDDPDRGVRIAACNLLSRSVNPDAVPHLLEAMRDPDSRVRDSAKAALDAIRFYHDEKAHWDRVFQGTSIGANSAAEALLQQAAPEADKEVRLMAIRSLGTLGVPEALPFLIRYSQEGDEEIAAAAKAAVAAINRRGGGG